ncbi:MAG TPA: hypothetical protein VNP96_03080 [Solirubrobacterales bacterium]|nr:hypothetical protein [Solirubrobacterales bacterium]
MTRRNRNLIAKTLGLSALLLGLATTPAPAAPSLGVEISRDAAAVSHSDERVDYAVSVANTAPTLSGPPSTGDKLLCKNGFWFREADTNYSFEFRWVRDGAAVTAWRSGTALDSSDTIDTYVVQPADAESAMQCLIKGTNGAKSGSYVAASQPMTVISPAPGIEPPRPNSTSLERRPAIAGVAGNASDELTCTAPTVGWSDSNAISPITWTFEWLRNGEPAPDGEVTETTATSSKFKIAASELTSKAVFQCLATATNAGGTAVVESFLVSTEAPAPEFIETTEDGKPLMAADQVPVVERADNTLIGQVTLEVELPGRQQTYVYKTTGNWNCDKVPPSGSDNAKAICTVSVLVKPQSSLPSLSVAAALGADAPDLAVARATAFGGGAEAPASDEDVFTFDPALPFGLTVFETGVFDCDGTDYTQAGGHPCYGEANFVFAQKRVLSPNVPTNSMEDGPVEQVKQNVTDLPRGFVGNPLAVPELCPSSEEVSIATCPPGSRVGGIDITLSTTGATVPIYAIEPEFGTPAQFAFTDPAGNLYTLSAKLRPEDGYAPSLELAPAPQANVLEADVFLCNFGARATGAVFEGCKEREDADANPKPLFANPTRCDGPPPTVRTRFNTWEQPERWVEYSFSTPAITGCEAVEFDPTMSLAPTSAQADSPSGLDVELQMPTEGLETRDGISQANMKKAVVRFPEGMAVNATAGHGLGSCSAEQVKLKTNEPISCPDSSKVGTIEIDTPLLRETLTGAAYIARQGDVGGALIGLYLVFESKKDGIIVKVPGRVDPDPATGRLTVTVDESPEAPFSAVRMHFPGGPRATLLTPPKCGSYEIEAELFPWTGGPSVLQKSSFEVTQGPNGGPCPTGALEPKLSAGVTNPTAGQTSPFSLRLTREDGTQRFSGLTLAPPQGLTAYLAGLPYCSDATLAAISAAPGTGQAQIDSPSCPAAAQIGTASAGAGAGADPFYVQTGRAYLAGPYKGAPLSIAVVTPAVAGPLDLGNVVIRNAVYVDPKSAEITVASDPIPTILHGILLDIRDIRVAIDRPGFILNPTSCEPKQIGVEVKGMDGASASLSNRFQVGGCESLGFKPRVNLRLFGATKRGAYQGVQAIVRPRPGDANIAATVVRFPRSAFVAQEHIRTICTRVQFAADQCPKGSIYGRALARSPLVDYPLEGNVYLRSSDNELPDAVADLRGPAHQPIRIELAIRNDSVGGALRNTVQSVPDAPVSYFRLRLFGGNKGLIVNSRDICEGANKATVRLGAQNGRSALLRPQIRNSRCAKERKRAKRGHKRHP